MGLGMKVETKLVNTCVVFKCVLSEGKCISLNNALLLIFGKTFHVQSVKSQSKVHVGVRFRLCPDSNKKIFSMKSKSSI